MNLFTAIALMSFVAAPVPKDDPVKDAQAALQGEWKFLSWTKLNRDNPELVKKGKVVVAGDTLTIKIDDEDNAMTFALDPTTDPPTFDFKGKNGGKDIRGIYKLDKDKLTICFGIEGSLRPTDYKPGRDNGVMVLELVKK